MRYYTCDKKPNNRGYHEIHTLFCPNLPPENRRKNVGKFTNCKSALQSLHDINIGKSFMFIGCNICCRPCSSPSDH